MYNRDIKQIIKEVNGTMAIEGMPLTIEDKKRIETCLVGKVSFTKMRKELIKKHTVKR